MLLLRVVVKLFYSGRELTICCAVVAVLAVAIGSIDADGGHDSEEHLSFVASSDRARPFGVKTASPEDAAINLSTELSRPLEGSKLATWPTEWIGFTKERADDALVKAIGSLGEELRIDAPDYHWMMLPHYLADLCDTVLRESEAPDKNRYRDRKLSDVCTTLLAEIPYGVTVAVQREQQRYGNIGFRYSATRERPASGGVTKESGGQTLWAVLPYDQKLGEGPESVEQEELLYLLSTKQEGFWDLETTALRRLVRAIGSYRVWLIFEHLLPGISPEAELALAYHATQLFERYSSRQALQGLTFLQPYRIEIDGMPEDWAMRPWTFCRWIEGRNAHKEWALTALWAYATERPVPAEPLVKIEDALVEPQVVEYRAKRLLDKHYKGALREEWLSQFSDEKIEARFWELVELYTKEYKNKKPIVD